MQFLKFYRDYVLSATFMLVDLFVAIMHVLEVSAAFMQVKVSAANMWVTIFIEIMQVGVSVVIMQVVFSTMRQLQVATLHSSL